LVVRAIDAGNSRLSGATVTVTGPSPATSQVSGSPAVTPANGETSFANLFNGTYTVLVQKTGYSDQTVAVTLAGVGVTQVVTMVPASGPGSILVTLLHSDGSPYSSGSRNVVRIYEPDGSTYTQYHTESDGTVLVTGKAAGAYSVTWRGASGSWSTKIPVTVSAGTQAAVTVNSVP
jgi:hypothetical protein